ncbi:PREDICTED: uncharacterized protein LOC104799760 [Tarenaya hassleriana]|uniref:uncharacterized protein LOC104799760 n=1 Tax=Tarenaya hassleriana TaxID=28532 RepID=UPI0008FCE56F|nr:PREDICTED: uncharacterized protein LOC104799760 [Tarenaya hassleriana]
METDTSFPEADVHAELNPGHNKSFQVDPVSSEIVSNKVQEEIEKKENAKAERDALQTLKSAIIVTAVIAAVAGAAFAITKKMKEK